MRYFIVLLSCTVVLSASTTEPWKEEADKLFGKPNITKDDDTSTTKDRASETSVVDNVNPTNNSKAEDKSCFREDGSKGECVVYYQCDSESKNFIVDGSSLIDIRIDDRPCIQYLDVCCGQGSVNRSSPVVPPSASGGCGYTNPGASGEGFRISEPDYAEYAEFPWMLAVLKKALENGIFTPKNYVGGASLIHPRVALTAAHKVDTLRPSDVKIRAGEWDTQTEKENYPYQERDVKKILIHEDFYRASVLNSVALLIVSEPFKLAPHVDVACVGRRIPPPATPCFSMGWGKDNFGDSEKYAVVLKKVPVPIVSREKCQTSLRGTRLGSYFVLHRSFTCAGGKPGVDTCRGDGGSPLVCPIDDTGTRFAVVGTVAWGIGCGEGGIPGVYTDVTLFRDWIQKKLKDEGLPIDCFEYSDERL